MPNVDVRNIDDLRGIADRNLKMRLAEVKNAENIIDSELKKLELQLRCEQVEPIISAICNRAESVRQKELAKALKKIGEIDQDQRRVIEVMTRLMVERVLIRLIDKLRKAAIAGNYQIVSTAQELFDTQLDGEAQDYLSRNTNEYPKTTNST